MTNRVLINDESKTKKQLISELTDLRQQLAKVVKEEGEYRREEDYEKLEARLRTVIESLPFDFLASMTMADILFRIHYVNNIGGMSPPYL